MHKNITSKGRQEESGGHDLDLKQVEFRPRRIKQYKVGHHIMLKATIHGEDINIYSPNISTAFIEQKW